MGAVVDADSGLGCPAGRDAVRPRLRNPALLTLWGGEFASRIGITVFQIALLWYLLERTGDDSLKTGRGRVSQVLIPNGASNSFTDSFSGRRVGTRKQDDEFLTAITPHEIMTS